MARKVSSTHVAIFAVFAAVSVSVEAGKVDAGRRFSLLIDPENSRAYATGENNYGQLGVGDFVSRENRTEVLLPEGETVVDVAAGAFHSLFLTASGTAYGAGRSRWGQLPVAGIAAFGNSTPVALMTGVQAVAAGYAYSLFLLQDGTVLAAGSNSHGQLGNISAGDNTLDGEPVTVVLPEGTVVSAVSAGYDFSYFLTEAHDVYVVGQNLGGQLGDGTRATKYAPVKALENVQAVAAGHTHGLFLTTSGAVLGTGANYDLQLGLNDAGYTVTTPTDLGFAGAGRIAAGGDSSSALVGSTLSGFGSNRQGQLGLGVAVDTASKTEIPVADVQAAALGDSHTLVKTLTLTYFGMGTNADGELGDGTKEQRWEPSESFSYIGTATGTQTATSTATLTEGDSVTVTQSLSSTETTTTTAGGLRTTSTRTDTRGGQGGGFALPHPRILIGIFLLLAAVPCLYLACRPEDTTSVAPPRTRVSADQGGHVEFQDMH